MLIVVLLVYLVLGCIVARGAEFADGSKGFQSGMAPIIALFWPLFALSVFIEVCTGEAKLKWRGKRVAGRKDEGDE